MLMILAIESSACVGSWFLRFIQADYSEIYVTTRLMLWEHKSLHPISNHFVSFNKLPMAVIINRYIHSTKICHIFILTIISTSVSS